MWHQEFWSWVMVEWWCRRLEAMIRCRLAHVLYQLWTESPRICLDSAADCCAVTTDERRRCIFQAYRYSPWDQPSKPQCTSGCHQHIGDAACQMSQSHMIEGPHIDLSTEVQGLIPAGHCSRMRSARMRCRIGVQTSTWQRSMTRTSWVLDLSLQTCAEWRWLIMISWSMQSNAADWSRATRIVDVHYLISWWVLIYMWVMIWDNYFMAKVCMFP